METKMKKEKLIKILKEKGISPTLQRIKIYEYLLESKEHPTIDMIYKDLIGEIPTLSKTTIYNTLYLFKEKGLVQELTIDENEIRFDARTDLHAHFKCIKCGKIFDLEFISKDFRIKNLENYKVLEYHLYIKGICPDCLKSY